ncbi:enhancer of polycomb-like-domain-containing protein [Lineolata rhizophorae]|uniref:Enhancer of polycomb-like protein n=1 Tax=Lineolata rhizophorae TaxID=578093 RepID=A0A6A6P0H1_9PEZI|nr:enhancer of polycomb-like-domain-containing protein [Lineolata rhizophorae]
MTARVTSQRFRQRKLSTKQNLSILRESDVETGGVDDEAQRHIPRVETGVEKGEEIEHHLQAVISAAQAGGNVANLYIPTPEAKPSSSHLTYDRLYPPVFRQPATYIRFSSTVEDCIGTPYCMTDEDDLFLKTLNSKRSKPATQPPCSEDQFEALMSFFDETAAAKQPFAAMTPEHPPPVLGFDEMEDAFAEVDEPSPALDDAARRLHARDVYDHWRELRVRRSNRPLMPTLKPETGADTDDADPYVCFRRREVRQVRKTRGRDAQVAEKLKKLRGEMESARQLVHFVKQREAMRKEQLGVDRTVFEHRAALRDAKRNLGLKEGDEDLLINQKAALWAMRQQTHPTLTFPHHAQPSPKPRGGKPDGPAVKPPNILGPRPQVVGGATAGRTETDLVSLADIKEKKRDDVNAFIEDNVEKHNAWNNGFVDWTWRPLTPPGERSRKSSFRPLVAQGLPTPPSSAEDHQDADGDVIMGGTGPAEANAGAVMSKPPLADKLPDAAARYVSPPFEPNVSCPQPAFRRRMGRGGRLMIDRRNPQPTNSLPTLGGGGGAVGTERPYPFGSAPAVASPTDEDSLRVMDRYRYDYDDSDEDAAGEPVYPVDPYSATAINFRVLMDMPRRAPVDQTQAAQAAMMAAAQQGGQQQQQPKSPQQLKQMAAAIQQAAGLGGSNV